MTHWTLEPAAAGGKYDAWKCAICGLHYVVPGLARDCEARHEQETAPATTPS